MQNIADVIDKVRQATGFGNYEATLWVYCLLFKEDFAAKIIRKSGLKRNKAYEILKKLEKKGFIRLSQRAGKYYVISVPIREAIENYKQFLNSNINQKISKLEKIVPLLEKLWEGEN